MIPLAYIAAPSYSGSTLLTMLLNQHPAVATIGELKWGAIDLATYPCSCGVLLRDCPFWDAVEADVRAAGLPFDRARPITDFRCRQAPWVDRVVRARVRGGWFERLRDVATARLPRLRHAWPAVRTMNRAIITSVLARQGGRCFVDGSKDPVRLRHLSATGDYDIRVLHLVRDGRGVVNSALRHQAANAAAAARDWRLTHVQVDRVAARLGRDRRLIIHYEELCRAPESTLARVYDFLGLPPTNAGPADAAQPHHVLGNQMRLRAAAPIRLDEAWRSTLPAPALATFARVAGAANRRLGYA